MDNAKKYVLKRGLRVPVMMTPVEREELEKAAQTAGMGLSVFLRVMALEAARRRETRAA
jgi:predicted alpha/beta-hydrolase family hydrolase